MKAYLAQHRPNSTPSLPKSNPTAGGLSTGLKSPLFSFIFQQSPLFQFSFLKPSLIGGKPQMSQCFREQWQIMHYTPSSHEPVSVLWFTTPNSAINNTSLPGAPAMGPLLLWMNTILCACFQARQFSLFLLSLFLASLSFLGLQMPQAMTQQACGGSFNLILTDCAILQNQMECDSPHNSRLCDDRERLCDNGRPDLPSIEFLVLLYCF